jgi:hypothetical protein
MLLNVRLVLLVWHRHQRVLLWWKTRDMMRAPFRTRNSEQQPLMQEQHRQLGSALLGLTAIGASGRLGWEIFLSGLRIMDYINQDKHIVLRRGGLPDSIPHLLIAIHSRTVYTLLPLTPPLT